MTKKELEKKVEEQREEIGELRYKVSDCDKQEEKTRRLENEFSKIEGARDIRTSMLEDQVRNLKLKVDVLTMTPDQIETMLKVKAKQPTDDPLDLPRHNYERRLR